MRSASGLVSIGVTLRLSFFLFLSISYTVHVNSKSQFQKLVSPYSDYKVPTWAEVIAVLAGDSWFLLYVYRFYLPCAHECFPFTGVNQKQETSLFQILAPCVVFCIFTSLHCSFFILDIVSVEFTHTLLSHFLACTYTYRLCVLFQ